MIFKSYCTIIAIFYLNRLNGNFGFFFTLEQTILINSIFLTLNMQTNMQNYNMFMNLTIFTKTLSEYLSIDRCPSRLE